jgi:ribosome maturation factor RimP
VKPFEPLGGVCVKKVSELTAELALPLVEQAGCTLWDVEYVREAGTWYLRVLVDCEGGVSINQCEAISRPLSDLLDEKDPIEGSYVLEVGSAGADRALKKPEHFAACMGQEVELRLYQPLNGSKVYVGRLKAYEDGNVTIESGGSDLCFDKSRIALVKLHISI